jgi:putative membrane protein insertion efficiency factor
MRARVRRLPILAASALLLVLLADLSRAPERQLSVKAAVAGIHAYQRTASPLLARVGVRCRFQPTCSHYAEASLQRYGLLRGGWRSARRVLRCGPWTPEGTVDRP